MTYNIQIINNLQQVSHGFAPSVTDCGDKGLVFLVLRTYFNAGFLWVSDLEFEDKDRGFLIEKCEALTALNLRFRRSQLTIENSVFNI